MGRKGRIELHVPAGNLVCLQAAVDQGADVVYFGFSGPSNLRNFAGINFSLKDAAAGIKYAQAQGKKAFVTVNTFPQGGQLACCYEALDLAYELGADGVVISDFELLRYARQKDAGWCISLSVQAGACHAEAIAFYVQEFGVEYVILPRTLTVEEIGALAAEAPVKLEVFAFGSLCINFEGRCFLSSYITGESTNTIGTCSTPKYLSFEQSEYLVARMCGRAINRYTLEELRQDTHFAAGLPREELSQWGNHFMINRRQICKGRFHNQEQDKTEYSLNNLVYLNALGILPRLIQAGVAALKVEGRQRNAEYVRRTARMFREAIDTYYTAPEQYRLEDAWEKTCQELFPQITPSVACYLGK